MRERRKYYKYYPYGYMTKITISQYFPMEDIDDNAILSMLQYLINRRYHDIYL